MDPISLSGAYESIKATKELLSAVFSAKVDAEAKPKILEAQAKLGEIQDLLFHLRERLAGLQEERDALRAQLTEVQDWKSRAQDYELSSTVGGAVVFKFKASPDHYACPSCFNKREVHVLQDSRVMRGTFRCPGCNADYPVKRPTSFG